VARAPGPREQVARTADFAVRVFSVAIIHLNPVTTGLVSHPEDWRWSSYNEYAGMSPDEQRKCCGLIVDRVRMPSDPRAGI
jgi:hypothetical protein